MAPFTYKMTRGGANGTELPACTGEWLSQDWMCFSQRTNHSDFRVITTDSRARTTTLTYTVTGSDTTLANGTPNTVSVAYTVEVPDAADCVPAPGQLCGGDPEDTTFELFGPPFFGDTPDGQGPTQAATVGEAFAYTAPEATDHQGDAIAYTAALVDGSALPDWLSFNATTRVFSGTPAAGDAPAELAVVMTATDDARIPLSGTWSFTLTVSAVSESTVTGDTGPQVNHPPVFETEAEDQTATVDEAFSYTLPAVTDPNDDGLAWVATADYTSLPEWLSFDADSRTFSGTPGAADAPAELSIGVMVTDDGEGELSSATYFTLTVQEGGATGDTGPQANRAPVFETEAAAQAATEDEAFSYTVPAATDPDSDALTYSAALSDGGALPEWLSFAPGSRTFSGTPGAGDAPATLTIEVTATDDGEPALSDKTRFTLSVEEKPPSPPTASAGADLEGKRGGEVTLSGSGTLNAQGSQDALTYSWRIKNASHTELKSGTSWLSNATQATATYSVPRRKDVTDRRAVDDKQWVAFELTVTDGDGETATDTVRMTIKGSTWKAVKVSVADATAEESSGSIAFAVSLSAASRDPVSVDYATSNGTAVAGTDYTAASGTLTFAPGETSKTVTVTIIDDVHDEGTETLTLTLSNPRPAGTAKLADATATGSISNADPLQQEWLARFGRAAASDAIAAVTARFETPRGAGSHLTLGGHRLSFDGSGDSGAGAGLPPAVAPGGVHWPSWSGDPDEGAERTMSVQELLLGTSFRAVLGRGAGSQWTSWGQGASVSQFSGEVPGLSLSGETATGSLGMDYERSGVLTGFAMTHSLGEGTASGAGRTYAMGSTVTTMLVATPHPLPRAPRASPAPRR